MGAGMPFTLPPIPDLEWRKWEWEPTIFIYTSFYWPHPSCRISFPFSIPRLTSIQFPFLWEFHGNPVSIGTSIPMHVSNRGYIPFTTRPVIIALYSFTEVNTLFGWFLLLLLMTGRPWSSRVAWWQRRQRPRRITRFAWPTWSKGLNLIFSV